jgi:Flp pilus assembly protein TadD
MLEPERGTHGIHDRTEHMQLRPARPFWPLLIGGVFVTGCWASAASATDDKPGQPAAKQVNAEDKELGEIANKVKAGRLDEALAALKEKAAKHPEWSPVQLILARLLFAANQAVPGRRALEKAASEAPDHPEVYMTFGNLALSEGRFSDARLNFENALSLVGTGGFDAEKASTFRRVAFDGLAKVAESREDWKLAETRLRALLELDSKNGAARQRLGAALFRLGKTKDAFTALEQAVKDTPALDPPGVSMALLFSQKGDNKKAEEWFDYAQQADPKSARVHTVRANWLFERGQAKAARPEIEEAVKLEPASKDAQRLHGLIAWHLRDLTAAEQILERLHRDLPADAVAANLLALALVEQEDATKRKRGLELADVNTLQFARSTEVQSTLVWALYRQGRVDHAHQKLREIFSGVRLTPDIAYFFARVVADKGLTDDARKLLQWAMQSPLPFAHRDDATALVKSLTK